MMSGVAIIYNRLIPLHRILAKTSTTIVRYNSTLQHDNIKVSLTKHPKSGGKSFSDHMLCCYWSEEIGWDIPNIIPYSDIPVSPACKALQYGVECFEGMKAFSGIDKKIRLFRPKESMKRLKKSAHAIALPEFDINEYLECVKKLIQADRSWVPTGENCSLYIQSTFIGTEPCLFPLKKTKAALLYCITSPQIALNPFEPISLYADPQFVRTWKGSVGSDTSIGGLITAGYAVTHIPYYQRNYAPILRYQTLARSLGCNEVLWLFGPNEQLTEVGSIENLFVYWINEDGDTEIATPALDDRIVLPGVMRSSLVELGSSWDSYQVVERQITLDDIRKAVKENRMKEMFATEKTCVIRPVNKILYMNEDILIPTMETGLHATIKFHKEITDIQYGRVEHNWCDVVD